MEQEFYRALAERVRLIADKADPFTRRRLLDLATRYGVKGGTSRSGPAERPPPVPRTTPPASSFSGSARADAHVPVVLDGGIPRPDGAWPPSRSARREPPTEASP
jgi:hypothetical protein